MARQGDAGEPDGGGADRHRLQRRRGRGRGRHPLSDRERRSVHARGAAFRRRGHAVLPLALLIGVRWPPRRDWPAVAGLGFMFFAVFFVFYNVALAYTTVARARSRSRPCR